jgi:hypothetical protein
MHGTIAAETLAVELSPVYREGEAHAVIDVNGETATVGLERVRQA